MISIHEDAGLIPGLTHWLRIGIAMGCGVAHRCSWNPALLWLWCRLAAIALFQPVASEPPYATGAALKRQNKIK